MSWSPDVRYACRALRRAPGFATGAVLTIGLGVGVTTAVLTVADTVLRRPLPYPHAERLVRFVDEPSADGPAERTPTTVEPDELAELERRLTLVTELGVYVGATATITSGGDAIPLTITRMSASFFPMLGVSPVFGRPFTRVEERGAGALPLVL
ncbi:MAG: ABC transporter permease, partial [Acidobacteria bacterium]|nr:ABC transporter permease [Acidobacteriota bacterium]